MLGINQLGLSISGTANSPVENIITATISPVAQALEDGDALSTITNYATLINTANYASTAGTISSAVIQVDGTTQASGAFTVSDTEAVTVLVTDSAANTRSWTVDGNVTHAAPTASGGLVDQAFPASSGTQTYDVSVDFSGNDLSYSLAQSIAGVSINASSGVISWLTGTTAIQSGTILTAQATNSGGTAQSGFQFSISEAFSVENIGGEPVITATNGNVSVTIGTGPYAGTYTQRVTDSAQLTVAMIEAAPTPLVLPVITGTETEGEVLTATPGLWFYAGADKGDQTHAWQNDIDGDTGITALTYTLVASDVGDTISVDETYGGVLISSASTGVISAAAAAPVLSSPVDAKNGSTASTGSVSTDQDDGSLYWVVTTSATAPSPAQVKLGQDNSGVAATDSGSQVVSATGVQTITPAPSGLSASTAYTTHFMHENAGTQQSLVSSASGFTTDAGTATIATDTAAIQWLDPDNVVTSGGGTVLDQWPNSAVSGSALYDMSVVPTGSTAPTWDAVNKRASNSGTQALVSSNIGASPFTEASLAANTYCFFAVADINALGYMWALSRDSGNKYVCAFGVGEASAPIRAAVGLKRVSSAFGSLVYGAQTLTNSIAPAKYLHELRFNDTTANFYVNGSLEWTSAVNAAGNTHQGFSDFYATLFGWGNQTETEASHRARGDLYEFLLTTDLVNADAYRAELAARHGITI